MKFVSPNAPDNEFNTPLHLVGELPTAKQLVAAGATTNTRNLQQRLPHEETTYRSNEVLIMWLKLAYEKEIA